MCLFLQVLGLARDLVPRGSSPQPLWKGQNHHQQQQQLSRPSTPRGPSTQRGQPTTQQVMFAAGGMNIIGKTRRRAI